MLLFRFITRYSFSFLSYPFFSPWKRVGGSARLKSAFSCKFWCVVFARYSCQASSTLFVHQRGGVVLVRRILDASARPPECAFDTICGHETVFSRDTTAPLLCGVIFFPLLRQASPQGCLINRSCLPVTLSVSSISCNYPRLGHPHPAV